MGMKLGAAAPLWKTVWQFLKIVENRITIGSNNSTSGRKTKRLESRDSILESSIHNKQKVEAALFTIGKR